MLYLGKENPIEMPNGVRLIGQHLINTPLEHNTSVILVPIGIWYVNYYDGGSYVTAPHDQCLHRLPKFIQQPDMESNGKQVTLDDKPVGYETPPVIWGEIGINGQHAFLRLLYQGTHITSIDLIALLEKRSSLQGHHEILLANISAQTEALIRSKIPDEIRAELKVQGMEAERIGELAPHKTSSDNRPTNLILMDKISSRNMGSLITMYEHRTLVQGIIWGINSSDQWGIELNKQLAKTILAELNGETEVQKHDSSATRLINLYLSTNK